MIVLTVEFGGKIVRAACCCCISTTHTEKLVVKHTNKDKGFIISNRQISPPHEYAALELVQTDKKEGY